MESIISISLCRDIVSMGKFIEMGSVNCLSLHCDYLTEKNPSGQNIRGSINTFEGPHLVLALETLKPFWGERNSKIWPNSYLEIGTLSWIVQGSRNVRTEDSSLWKQGLAWCQERPRAWFQGFYRVWKSQEIDSSLEYPAKTFLLMPVLDLISPNWFFLGGGVVCIVLF